MRAMSKLRGKFIDIGANLTDDMFQGLYHGSKKHEPDLNIVLERSWNNGLDKIIITGGSLTESEEALKLARTDCVIGSILLLAHLFSTVGCHPTRCGEFDPQPEEYLNKLAKLIDEGKDKIIAIGECGLDYDRLNFCDKEIQLKYFEYQLELCEKYKLPLFLHCRAAADDLIQILERHKDKLSGGVVHSFDGTEDAMNKIIALGFHIGINGCSLRTEESLRVAAKIPSDKLMIETDCPWCEVKPTHPSYAYVKTKFPSVKKEKHSVESMVKGRNEPANIVQIVEILAAIRKEDPEELSQKILDNTNSVFFKNLS